MNNGIRVVRLLNPGFPSANPITGVFDALNGEPGLPQRNALARIEMPALEATFFDAGLNNANRLPTSLGGIRILFDGVPVPIFQIADGYVICVSPGLPAGKNTVGVTVEAPTGISQLITRSSAQTLGVLTGSFPARSLGGQSDAVAYNDNGSRNDADHPAARGSKITIFATSAPASGALTLQWIDPAPVLRPGIGVSGTARKMVGFIDGLSAVDIIVPSTNAGSGRAGVGPSGRTVGVYIK